MYSLMADVLTFISNFEYNQFIQPMNSQKKSGSFISKLNTLLQDPEYGEIIRWAQNKTMIDLVSLEKMETSIMPSFFRHKKIDSFIRQLNLYGFRKVKWNQCPRFTHTELLRGEKLLSIISLKQERKEKAQPVQESNNVNRSEIGINTQIEENNSMNLIKTIPTLENVNRNQSLNFINSLGYLNTPMQFFMIPPFQHPFSTQFNTIPHFQVPQRNFNFSTFQNSNYFSGI